MTEPRLEWVSLEVRDHNGVIVSQERVPQCNRVHGIPAWWIPVVSYSMFIAGMVFGAWLL